MPPQSSNFLLRVVPCDTRARLGAAECSAWWSPEWMPQMRLPTRWPLFFLVFVLARTTSSDSDSGDRGSQACETPRSGTGAALEAEFIALYQTRGFLDLANQTAADGAFEVRVWPAHWDPRTILIKVVLVGLVERNRVMTSHEVPLRARPLDHSQSYGSCGQCVVRLGLVLGLGLGLVLGLGLGP